MPTDIDRIYELLKGISDKLDDFRQSTERRLAVLEERGSAAKAEATDRRLTDLERFQSKVGVYLTVAAFAGATVVGVALKLLHLG